jgi:hypothetical protein
MTEYIWLAVCPVPWSFNDINIRDQSPLVKTFSKGLYNDYVDFEFKINGYILWQVWDLCHKEYMQAFWAKSSMLCHKVVCILLLLKSFNWTYLYFIFEHLIDAELFRQIK